MRSKYFLLKIWRINLMKSVCAIFTLYQIAFCYFFQASEEDKTDNDNHFKISWATYWSKTILDSAKQNDILEFRIFSHPLFWQPLNGMSSLLNITPTPKNSQLKKAFEKYNCELIFEVLRYFILFVMLTQPIFGFTELVTGNPMQIFTTDCY